LAEPSHPAARCGELLQLLDSNVDGGVGDATEGGALKQRAAGTAMTERGQLVVLFQRGAADGLDIVVPFSGQITIGCGSGMR